MGRRVYVHKKHIVEYGAAAFNYQSEEFKDALNTLGLSVCGDEYGDEFEVDKEYYKLALDTIKKHKNHILNWEKGDYNSIHAEKKIKTNTVTIDDDGEKVSEDSSYEIELEVYPHDFLDVLKELNMTIDEFIEDMENFYKSADKHCEYLHFSVW